LSLLKTRGGLHCRGVLLDKLRERLRRPDIDAQPEGHYADDKRADIRVSFGGAQRFNVPIEIKRDSHRDLWRAIHEQLIPRYTRDPGAAGQGIYLVLWFGREEMPKPSAGVDRPPTALDLEDRLRDSLITNEERRLIQVFVIDVSKPECGLGVKRALRLDARIVTQPLRESVRTC